MMPLKDSSVKSKDSENLEKSKALNTEEILSLLDKTSNDFTKESEISEIGEMIFNWRESSNKLER